MSRNTAIYPILSHGLNNAPRIFFGFLGPPIGSDDERQGFRETGWESADPKMLLKTQSTVGEMGCFNMTIPEEGDQEITFFQ